MAPTPLTTSLTICCSRRRWACREQGRGGSQGQQWSWDRREWDKTAEVGSQCWERTARMWQGQSWYNLGMSFISCGASLVTQTVKNLPAMWETQVWSLGREDPVEKGMQPTPVFLPGEFHGQRSLVGYSPRGHKESDTTERLTLSLHFIWWENEKGDSKAANFASRKKTAGGIPGLRQHCIGHAKTLCQSLTDPWVTLCNFHFIYQSKDLYGCLESNGIHNVYRRAWNIGGIQ